MSLILIIFVLLSNYFYYQPDDSFIGHQISRNIANGNGFSLNKGEILNISTSPLYIIINTIPHFFNIDPVQFANLYNFLLGLIIIIFTYRLSLILSDSKFISALSVIIMVAYSTITIWTFSGMETFTITLIHLMTFYCFLKNKTILWTAFIPVTVFIRPDAVLIGISIFLYCLFSHTLQKNDDKNNMIKVVLITIMSGLLFFFINSLLFEEVLPTSYYVKRVVSFDSFLFHIKKGIQYLLAFILGHKLFALALLFPFVYWPIGMLSLKNRQLIFRLPRISDLGHYFKHSDIRFLVLYLFILVHAFYLIYVGGDWMMGFRFLIPITPELSILIAMIIGSITIRLTDDVNRDKILKVGLSLYLLMFFALGLYNRILSPILAWPNFKYSYESRRSMIEIGHWLKENVDPSTTLAIYAVGAVKYYSELYIIDMGGLSTKYLSKNGKRDFLAIGHEIWDMEYVLSRTPDIIWFGVYGKDNGQVPIKKNEYLDLDNRSNQRHFFATEEKEISPLNKKFVQLYEPRSVKMDTDTRFKYFNFYILRDRTGKILNQQKM